MDTINNTTASLLKSYSHSANKAKIFILYLKNSKVERQRKNFLLTSNKITPSKLTAVGLFENKLFTILAKYPAEVRLTGSISKNPNK